MSAQAVQMPSRELFSVGDADTFAALVKQHQSMVFSMAYARCGPFGGGGSRPGRFSGAAPRVAGAGFAGARSQLAQARGRAPVHRPAAPPADLVAFLSPSENWQQAPEPAAPPSRVVEGDILLTAALRQLIAGLPAKPRLVMILRYQEDMEATEIAEVLKMPLGTSRATCSGRSSCCATKLARYGEISI